VTRKRPSSADSLPPGAVMAGGTARGRGEAQAAGAKSVYLEGDALRDYQERDDLKRQISQLPDAIMAALEQTNEQEKKLYHPRAGGRLLAKFYKQRVAAGDPAGYEDVMDDVRKTAEYRKNRHVRSTCSYHAFRRVVRAIESGTLDED
jgi:hypothetical protein